MELTNELKEKLAAYAAQGGALPDELLDAVAGGQEDYPDLGAGQESPPTAAPGHTPPSPGELAHHLQRFGLSEDQIDQVLATLYKISPG